MDDWDETLADARRPGPMSTTGVLDKVRPIRDDIEGLRRVIAEIVPNSVAVPGTWFDHTFVR